MALCVDKYHDLSASSPRLGARWHPHIIDFLQDRERLFSLVGRYGSPLNLIFPDNLRDNIESFQAVYKKHHVRGDIYFTSKPCKSLALYRAACGFDVKIDVSSERSLDTVLDCGWSAGRIGATGPKSKGYLNKAIERDVLLNIDNLHELKQVVDILGAMKKGKKQRITLRIADYGPKNAVFINAEDTTFGICSADIPWALSFIKEHDDKLLFDGFTFHASMASDEQRIAAFQNQLDLSFYAVSLGLKPRQVNIGGGFPIMYADSCQQWADYTALLKESVLGKVPSQTWNKNGLGFRVENGVLRGAPAYINHAPVYTKGEELDRWLSFRLPIMGNSRFVDIIRDSLLHLCIEPGRAMLDQCGVTIGCVSFVKDSAHGETLVGLDMNRSNLHSNHFKQLTEPMVIARGDSARSFSSQGVYYIGNLCMAFDMLQYNKTYPVFLPQADDLVIFSNTAAYMMDFTESEILMQPVAKK